MDHIFTCKVTRLLRDNIGENLGDLGLGQKFLDMTLIAWSIIEMVNKSNSIKVKTLCKNISFWPCQEDKKN